MKVSNELRQKLVNWSQLNKEVEELYGQIQEELISELDNRQCDELIHMAIDDIDSCIASIESAKYHCPDMSDWGHKRR